MNKTKNSDTWKIQLTIANKFVSSIDNDEERVIHSKSDNIETMINNEADTVIKEFFDSLKNRYQNNLVPMKGNQFVCGYVHLLYYKCHKIYHNRSGSYIGSPDRTENEKTATNPIHKEIINAFNTL